MNNQEQVDLLEKEQIIGHLANKSYQAFIKTFIEEKRIVLFETFQEISIRDTDDLLEVKRMLMTLDALEIEIKALIDTGKMASQKLNQQPMDKH